MKRLCPRGHRVMLVREGPNKDDGHCEECENVYPRSFLIPVVASKRVRKEQHKLYAEAFRAGYRVAIQRQLKRADAIIDLSGLE